MVVIVVLASWACLIGLLLAPVPYPLEEPYQTFCRRNHFSVKNRGTGAILRLVQNGCGSSRGALEEEPCQTSFLKERLDIFRKKIGENNNTIYFLFRLVFFPHFWVVISWSTENFVTEWMCAIEEAKLFYLKKNTKRGILPSPSIKTWNIVSFF